MAWHCGVQELTQIVSLMHLTPELFAFSYHRNVEEIFRDFSKQTLDDDYFAKPNSICLARRPIDNLKEMSDIQKAKVEEKL